MEEPDQEQAAAERPGPGRRAVLIGCGCAAVLLGACLLLALGPRLVHALQVRLADLDAVIVLVPAAPTPGFAPRDVARIVDRRLRQAGVLATVEPEGEGLRVRCQAGQRAAALALASRRGRLRMLAVVDDAGPREWARLERLRDEGSPDPDRAVVRGGGETLVVELPGFEGSELDSAYRTLDANGRPALGGSWKPAAAGRFEAFTGAHLGRRLAICVDDQLLSAPVIRSPIGARFVVEGGQAGFGEAELRALVAVLDSEPLPVALREAR